MPWVKLDDQFPDHPKIERAGERAAWLFVCGLCYCAEYLTDGFIPESKAQRLTAGSKPRIAALLEVGLWEKVDGGYEVVGYLEYQPPGDKVRADRAEVSRKRSEAGRKGAAARWHPDGNADGKGDGKGDGKSVAPYPYPSPTGETSSGEPTAVRPSTALSLLATAKHRTHGAEVDQAVTALAATHGPAAVERAVQQVTDRLGGMQLAWPSDVRKALEAELGPAPVEAKPHPLDDAQRAQYTAALGGLEQVRQATSHTPSEDEKARVLEQLRARRPA